MLFLLTITIFRPQFRQLKIRDNIHQDHTNVLPGVLQQPEGRGDGAGGPGRGHQEDRASQIPGT